MLAHIIEWLQRVNLVSRQIPNEKSPFTRALNNLGVETDRDGSPVSKQPSDWFVCFVPGLKKQWWHRFTHPKHKHVFALKMCGDDQWVLFEPWWTRIMVTTLRIDEAVKFLRWGAIGHILKVTERIPGDGNQWRGWSNCSVLTALMLGRSYWTWTPHGLFKRLTAEVGVEPVELAGFLEEKLISLTRRISEEAIGDIAPLKQLSPEAAFMELGRRISRMMFSFRYWSLYRFAISEAPRFPDAAMAFFKHGPRRAASAVRALISHFLGNGEVSDLEQERFARAFLSMLRGNLHIEILTGSRFDLDENASELRTKSVVDIFLYACGFCTRATREAERRDLLQMKKRATALREHVVSTNSTSRTIHACCFPSGCLQTLSPIRDPLA